MEKWVREFDSWDIVDGCCGNLCDKTPFAVTKAKEWCRREAEYEKRAGFVLMAELAVHDKNAKDQVFLDFLPSIINGASGQEEFCQEGRQLVVETDRKAQSQTQQGLGVHRAEDTENGVGKCKVGCCRRLARAEKPPSPEETPGNVSNAESK